MSCDFLPSQTLCRRPSPGEHSRGTYSVTSLGGVGSTFVLEWLKSLHRSFQHEMDCRDATTQRAGIQRCGKCEVLDRRSALPRHLASCHIDDDGIFKHLADPVALNGFGKGHRAVYIVGSPVRAISSVFRRRFQCWHYHRLHGCWFTRQQREGHIDCQSQALSAFRARFGESSTSCRVPPSGPLSTVKAYASQGEDLFGAVDQFKAWLSCRAPRCAFDILVIRYESLNASLPTLFDFLDLPQPVRRLFPHHKLRPPRSGSPRNLAADDYIRLLELYAPLEAAVERIPPDGLLLRNTVL